MTFQWLPNWSRSGARPLLAPEVVQTSSMDCGPAALKCLLEGHGVPVSYGRLREACQTSVDGTSIDTIEDVALKLGLDAEQVLIPRDFVTLDNVRAFPAIVVVRHADQATHFVVVWARNGKWLQIMDPAVGRRWVSQRRFEEEIFAHEQLVDAQAWRDWCDTDDFRTPMLARLATLGFKADDAQVLVAEAGADDGWFSFGSLDASARLCAALIDADGLVKGREAAQVTAALFRDTVASGQDIFSIIPMDYWSAIPDVANSERGRVKLRIRGGVMLKTAGHDLEAAEAAAASLPPELAAALTEETNQPLRLAFAMLREDGAFRPGMIAMALLVQTVAILAQVLLFRGLLDVASQLELPSQRLAALVAIASLTLISGLLNIGLAATAIGLGRRLEARLRRAILQKLPRLKDRYFQSRPITDMADRGHNIQLVRGLPGLGRQTVQSAFELVLTLIALAWIAPASMGWALLLVAVAAFLPFIFQPILNERDLRVRNHGGALHGFYLDALLGLAPIRAHRAERAIARQHEGLLVEWTTASRGLARWSVAADGIQMLVCTGLAAALLANHFAVARGISGTDLLLVFWTLRLPGIAEALSGLARSYPSMRNALLRQVEPLQAPDDELGTTGIPIQVPASAAHISIQAGKIVAGGHDILSDVNLTIAPGEHVAIVGQSGAGKSSLLGLLLGWHRLEEGALHVDGAPLSGETLARLRMDTAWVDPQIQLWNRTLLDNLTYAVDADDLSRIRALVETSGLMGISSRLPQGLQSSLGEGGGLLSGGEGQRVRLGRALLSASPRLALLDEPFRGLDRQQRKDLMSAARNWWRGTTLLCVTHDISETLDFPRVVVIHDGHIVEDGSPRDLACRNSGYRALLDAEMQVTHNRWQAADWRRWHVGGGQVSEAA